MKDSLRSLTLFSIEDNYSYFYEIIQNASLVIGMDADLSGWNIDFINMEERPIILITSEHNEKLKSLRELYDEKMKELEQVKFIKLGFFR